MTPAMQSAPSCARIDRVEGRSLLVELFDVATGEVSDSDVTSYLTNAIGKVSDHLADYRDRVEVEVSVNPEKTRLEGIAFFNADGQMLASVTAYYLEHDRPEYDDRALLQAVGSDYAGLQQRLRRLFG
jgi:hypothetical protein